MDKNRDLITINEVKENPFKINEGIDVSKINGTINLGVVCAIEFKDNSDWVRLIIGVRVAHNKKEELFSYSTASEILLNGWKEMSHKELDVRMNPAVSKLLSYCYAYLGGALKKYLDEKGYKNFYLPVIDARELMPHLIVKEIKA